MVSKISSSRHFRGRELRFSSRCWICWRVTGTRLAPWTAATCRRFGSMTPHPRWSSPQPTCRLCPPIPAETNPALLHTSRLQTRDAAATSRILASTPLQSEVGTSALACPRTVPRFTIQQAASRNRLPAFLRSGPQRGPAPESSPSPPTPATPSCLSRPEADDSYQPGTKSRVKAQQGSRPERTPHAGSDLGPARASKSALITCHSLLTPFRPFRHEFSQCSNCRMGELGLSNIR